MKPSDIIQQFGLETSSEENDFLVAADCADENGLSIFADFLRDGLSWLLMNKSQKVTSLPSYFEKYPYVAYGCNRFNGAGHGEGEYGNANVPDMYSIPHIETSANTNWESHPSDWEDHLGMVTGEGGYGAGIGYGRAFNEIDVDWLKHEFCSDPNQYYIGAGAGLGYLNGGYAAGQLEGQGRGDGKVYGDSFRDGSGGFRDVE